MSKGAEVPSAVDMPREPADTAPVSLRIPNAWLSDLDELAAAMSRPGIELVRSDVLRAAIARGILELRAELGLPARATAAERRRSRKR